MTTISLLDLLLPKQLDNAYRGWRIAVWFLAPIALFKTIVALNSIFFTRLVATTADGIPLDRFDSACASNVIALFALLGFHLLLPMLLGIVALFRYRAAIPLFYLMLLLEQLGNKALQWVYPTLGSGAASAQTGSNIVRGVLILTVIGFAFSLAPRPVVKNFPRSS